MAKLSFCFLILVIATVFALDEQPIESENERSPRQLFPYQSYYFNNPNPFYQRVAPYYPFSPYYPNSGAYVQEPSYDHYSDDVNLYGDVSSRQALGGNILCSSTSPLASSFYCTTIQPALVSTVPLTPFQVCRRPNNLNLASGTFQLLRGYGPRICDFYITIPDSSKVVSITCTTVTKGDTSTVFKVVNPSDGSTAGAITANTAVVSSGPKAVVNYQSTSSRDGLLCSWKSVAAPTTTTTSTSTTTTTTTTTAAPALIG